MRERAIGLVNEGRSRQAVCNLFGIDRKTLYHWLRCDDLVPQRSITRRGKLDKHALVTHVRDNPDALLRERGAHFGVHESSISRALKKLSITKKPHDTVRVTAKKG